MEEKFRVSANFNMSFDYGSFKRGQAYSCQKKDNDELFYVTAEEGTVQSFYQPEFDTFFTLLKN